MANTKLELITATSRIEIPKKYNKWSEEHPDAEVVRTNFIAVKDYDYTLLVFYKEQPKPEKRKETVEEFFDRIEREMEQMKYEFEHFFDGVPEDMLPGSALRNKNADDVSARILKGIEDMSK